MVISESEVPLQSISTDILAVVRVPYRTHLVGNKLKFLKQQPY